MYLFLYAYKYSFIIPSHRDFSIQDDLYLIIRYLYKLTMSNYYGFYLIYNLYF